MSPGSPPPLLQVEGLRVRFGGLTALDGVGLAVREGEIVAVIGPNGAGKTTLFNAIGGVVPLAGGRILVDGRPLRAAWRRRELVRWAVVGALGGMLALAAWRCQAVWQAAVADLHRWQQPFPWGRAAAAAWGALWDGWGAAAALGLGAAVAAAAAGSLWAGGRSAPERAAAAGLGRTFQNIRLFAGLTVAENVLVGLHRRLPPRPLGALLRLPAWRREERAAAHRVRELLALVGLEGLAQRRADGLPYGHQRRLEIARALAAAPRLLLLDEPAAGLNPSEGRELMALIRRIRDAGTAVLLIEHDMAVVMGVSDRVVVLDYGATIAEGTPAEVRADPDVIEAYLGKDA